jgi:hypothetical protein
MDEGADAALSVVVFSLANHVPSIESLKPGMLEVIEGSAAESKKWFG